MFIVRPLHYKLDFLHLHTLKIGLKIHVYALKLLGLAMPMHMSTFHTNAFSSALPEISGHRRASCKCMGRQWEIVPR